MKVHATRGQLVEWIRFKSGELSLRDVSDDTLILMAGGLKPGDVVVMPSGEYPVKHRNDGGRADGSPFGYGYASK